MIISLGAGLGMCLCWMGVLLLIFCFLSEFSECDGYVLSGREFSLDLIVVATEGFR